jgi:predicted outer membrane repeat protein
VPYYINPVNSDMPETDVQALIQVAANAWGLQSGANILPSYQGRTNGSTVTLNGRSEIFFREESNGNTYGQTYVWWNGSNQLIEADMIFYGGSVTFFNNSSACSGTAVYLQDAATHEFGHAFGLGHSDVSGGTMYPTLNWCSTYVRTLEPDDIAGILALYPAKYTAPAPATSLRIR